MYHVSEEYRVTHRKARYHYNRARLMGLVPVAVTGALYFLAGGHLDPLFVGGLGCALGFHLMLWSAYEAHFGGRHTRLTRHLLSGTDVWYPGVLILCQNGFIAVTVIVFWFILCTLGFPAGSPDHLLLGAWLITWPVLRVLRARHHAVPDRRGLENAFVFFRLFHFTLLSFLVASLVHSLFAPPAVYSNSPDQQAAVLDLFIWLPAVLIAVGCLVMFVDHLLRQRPRRIRPTGQDAL